MMLRKDDHRQNFTRDTLSADELFSTLPPAPRQALDLIERHVTISKDRIVFESGDQPTDIFVHRRGVAAISYNGSNASSGADRAKPNQIYGIVETLSGSSFDICLRTITDSDFDLISRDEFLAFVSTQPALAFKLAQLLSRLYQDALDQIKSH